MKKNLFAAICGCLIFVETLGAQSSNHLDLEPSPFGDFLQDDFDQYVADTKLWLKENRLFRSENHNLEVSVNSPFELVPNFPNGKGVLLIHGLSDSPYSFVDIGEYLASEGFFVRSILLPGHGGKPSDLMLTNIEDWLQLVKHHTELLRKQTKEVWIGGFSTGANLALIEAIDNPAVKGTLLFSPAIYSRKPLDFLAPIAKHIVDWADIDPETNITRFDSLTMNAAALYYETTKILRSKLKNSNYTKPVFMTLSEKDSVVDSFKTLELFNREFLHPNNHLVWYGEKRVVSESVSQFSMLIPEKRISTGSHMAALYSPENPFYGKHGKFRICNNGQSDAQEEACNMGAETWYSSFDYTEKGKIHARLTWNPYFAETMEHALAVMKSESVNTRKTELAVSD